MDEKIKSYLEELGNKYEVKDFMNEDPSQFIRFFSDKNDIEMASLFAAMISFGMRKQFLPKIKMVLEFAKNSFPNDKAPFSSWIKNEGYTKLVPSSGDIEEKFYRFYSYKDLQNFFKIVHDILIKYGSLENAIKVTYEALKLNNVNKKHELVIRYDHAISYLFFDSPLVPKGRNSANKRIHMYLRWMVRQNSPIDIGLWTWIDPKLLLIPVDIHVLQEAIKLNLLPKNAKADLKSAVSITKFFREIWPNDPCKGDYVLFGLGVDKK